MGWHYSFVVVMVYSFLMESNDIKQQFSLSDNGQTKPKPRKSKKGEASKPTEQLGESRCLFRATNGKRKISTVVRHMVLR